LEIIQKHPHITKSILNILLRVKATGEILANLQINETVAANAEGDGKVLPQGEMPAIGTICTAWYVDNISE
jgi:hypothetical protein